ncbi:hypothetical protein K502DRAFT_353658 [Neoconidiobolus thromboides FSU 785]|nr:hypothetical protein K502DRAFT_353658 [Neoconidiobolus thromboides FSU 785]
MKHLFQNVNYQPNHQQRPLKMLTITVGIITPLSILLSIPFIESSWMLNNVFENKEFKLHPINSICSTLANLFQLFGSITLVTRFWGKRIVSNTILSIVFFFIHFVLMTISIVFYYLNSEIKHKEVSYKFILSSVATCLSLVSVLFLTFDFIKYKTTSKNKIISKKHRMLKVGVLLTEFILH